MSSEQQSGPLADADLYALKEWIAETAVGFLLYGIYATFSLIAIYFLLTRNVGNKARLTLLAVIIFMFMGCTSLLILDLEFILVQIPLAGFNPPDPVTTGKLLGNIKISENFLERINFLVNDGIVVWRAWILFPNNRIVKAVLSICLLACCVCNIFDAASGAVNVLRNFQAVGAGTREFLVLTLPLLVTNVVATSLVGYKALQHRQDLRCNLNASSIRPGGTITKVQKILFLLVESGFIYIGFWASHSNIISAPHQSNLLVTDTAGLSFQVFIASTLPFLSALYPVLIILLVALENSKDKVISDPTLSQSMRFAVHVQPATTETSTLESGSPGDSHVNMEVYDRAKESV
ncbi:hypothetical protein BDP27DRAFT_1415392 [Rhodocollybia butyracea]|uniref:Uncharacterized protein n=1 Tax=Rhodocollybia butyracea TaxID=206335 RepID=A0A9P5UDW4_9AGAR|nr:hypothetical protein BDP27DRAFT_1415392 [Rhodocollybia butyracea]